MKKKVLVANWKMNKLTKDLHSFFEIFSEKLKSRSQFLSHTDVIIAPSYTLLMASVQLFRSLDIGTSAQNVHHLLTGAFTGEISLPMLKDLGVSYTLIGHSERRQYFNETDELVAAKTKICLEHAIAPIVCVGENKGERDRGETKSVVLRQLKAVLNSIDKSNSLMIAYEPVWAIGTGVSANPKEAQEVHLLIRNCLVEKFGSAGRNVSILYGGSVTKENIGSFLNQSDIDGALIGGASLDPLSFFSMLELAALND